MPCYLGIDTSNYTTSLAVYDSGSGEIRQMKKPLPVRQGQIGLRQSDAVFSHVKQLGGIAKKLICGEAISAVGASIKPRDIKGSYMPCFLVGHMAAEMLSAAMGVPQYTFSHQAGHIAASLYGSHSLELSEKDFLAFHVSGGTTECLHVSPGKDKPFDVTILSESRDLFAGQLIDRVGAMLELPFPSGSWLEELATGTASKGAKPTFREGNPCLSGLENQCRKLLDEGESHQLVAAYCIASVGNVVERMTAHALETYPGLPVVFAGGVMSNGIIRQRMEAWLAPSGRRAVFDGQPVPLERDSQSESASASLPIRFAPPQYSADNAAGTAILTSLSHEKETKLCRF